ncbi:HAMP domain-containing sensor histidine kinase [Paenibacillus sp. J2TS4]|uniref:sensor histidine kinase n=1 Tax=Paenibacillus sp. J2TS4 TaxID=2807194 RepID=UPI001B1CED7D|nr:HAMP domain-containing sensor histidine kinase [Paenibacillus sp. J2TS4]GIP35184.1 two-component sensor histidine kinase [Paenibacillus sp. J2TS4]
MRTLYIRIVLTFIGISMISSIVALALVNFYYLGNMREYSEQKIMNIANEIRKLYEETPEMNRENYLTRVANMGFQIYVVNGRMEGEFYGAPFKHTDFDEEEVHRVLAGETYHGIMEERHFLMVTGFFENSIRNSVGLPLQVDGETYAIFVRPNLEQQIGEVRILVALLLGITFISSIALIVIFTRYIVKPVKKLTEATDKIVRGDYNIEMDVSRRDEIGNLAQHFQTMAHSLKQLDEMRQEFVANVSHEIQSPLTSIQGFAQAILAKEVSPEEEERYMQIIEDESRRLSSLSKQLLTLAALDKETSVMKPSAFRLDEQIRQILIVTEWQWADKNLQVEPDLPEMVITADPQLLYQVWFNLITNSIKFCRPGDTIRIELRVEQEVVIEISDTGIGIPAAELPYIFDRFYKADRTRGRLREGSGLGLSIVHKIIDLHQGRIEVESELGEGTTFTVYLPYL